MPNALVSHILTVPAVDPEGCTKHSRPSSPCGSGLAHGGQAAEVPRGGGLLRGLRGEVHACLLKAVPRRKAWTERGAKLCAHTQRVTTVMCK